MIYIFYRIDAVFTSKEKLGLQCHLFIPADSRGQTIQKLTCTWHKHKNRQKGREIAEELQPMITSLRSNPSESKK